MVKIIIIIISIIYVEKELKLIASHEKGMFSEEVSEILALLEEQEQQESLKLFHCNAFFENQYNTCATLFV